MGCDIHAHLEVQLGDEKWHHWNEETITRAYFLFGKMAGVRDKEIEPIAQPRGEANEMSVETRFAYEYWKEDHHTPSWLESEDLRKLFAWLRSAECPFPVSYIGEIQEKYGFSSKCLYPDDYGFTDSRLVFWFDG